MPDAPAPLAGIRVLDFSRVLAGPFCTMNLADMGAEVIKIEEPACGDDTRAWGPPFLPHRPNPALAPDPAQAPGLGRAGGGQESVYFLSINRNKKSVALNLKSPEGVEIARRLAARSHVLIENFRPGTMERLGLGFEALRAENPRLVYCSISGFGQHGPDRDVAGYDVVIQGEGGVMSLTGFPDAPPVKVGISFADLVAGLYALEGILLALRVVEAGGPGQYIDISLLDCLISLLTFQAGSYFVTGRNPQRMGNLHPMITPYEMFATADGYVIVAPANEALWRKFCEVIGRPDLPADSRFTSNETRVRHREELAAILSPILAGASTAEWLRRFRAQGVPCGAPRNVGEVVESAQVRARGMVVSAEHPAVGTVQMLGNPVKLPAASLPPPAAPPVLGQHTEEVLAEVLGFSAQQIAAARSSGAI